MFVVLILNNAFKGLLRNQIINPPESWYHSIEELVNAPSDYQIYAPSYKITYYSIKKLANYNSDFEKLSKRIVLVPLESLIGLKYGQQFYQRKIGFLSTSLEIQSLFAGRNDIVTNEIQYDNVLDVRFIRKDFQFSDKMVQL